MTVTSSQLSILMIRVIDTMHVRFICASLQLSLVQLVVAYVWPRTFLLVEVADSLIIPKTS